VATLAVGNENEATVMFMVEFAFGSFLESGIWFCVWCIWQESAFSCCEDVFTFNLVYKEVL
jgi:hypothetical protein